MGEYGEHTTRPEQLPEPNLDRNKVDQGSAFVQLPSKLLFLAIIMLPDVLFAANQWVAYTANPSLQH